MATNGTDANPTPTTVRDPVCGMQIAPPAAHAARRVGGIEFYFCSPTCLKRFEAAPERYLPTAGPGAR